MRRSLTKVGPGPVPSPGGSVPSRSRHVSRIILAPRPGAKTRLRSFRDPDRPDGVMGVVAAAGAAPAVSVAARVRIGWLLFAVTVVVSAAALALELRAGNY